MSIRTRFHVLLPPAGCLAAVAILAGPFLAKVAVAQIRPYKANPWYWEYDGRPVLLIGGSNQDNLFQWAGDGRKLADHLDRLVACGGNYVRCTMSSRSYHKQGYRWDVYPYPFAKVGGRYDLTRWNESYWRKLREFLRQTQRRGLFVQLEFWDRWNESGDSRRDGNGWYYSPWNPENNINYDWSDSPLLQPGKTPFYNPFHYAAAQQDPVLLPFQKRFVGKILDTVIDGGFDHVIFQVDNESGIGDASLQPDPYWARFAREYAKSRGRHDLYVCTQRRFHWPNPYPTRTFRDWANPEIRVPIINDAFNYCDISQNNGVVGQEHYDNILWYRSQVRRYGPRPINNVKSYRYDWPIGAKFRERTAGSDREATARLWRAVFAGAASFRFHRQTQYARDGLYPGLGLNPLAQRHLRSMRRFVESVRLFAMEPHNDLLADRARDEAYCLAETGRQYAVFFTGGGDRTVTIDLSAADRRLRLRWLEVDRTEWTDGGKLDASPKARLRPPRAGRWIAVLRLPSPSGS